MFISITFRGTSIDETNKTQQKVRGSKFVFKISTIIHMHSNDYATTQSLMVLVAVSSLGATQLHLLEPGVKVNGDYYRNAVLLNMLLPDIRSVFGDYYVFQQDCQDGALAHRACDTCHHAAERERERRQSLSLQRCGHLIRHI